MTQTTQRDAVDVITPKTRIAAVDGLRGVAVLAVMLFHTESRLVPAGFLGVDVFFVISGFLITDILFRGAGWSGLGGFWLRRARRLAPALMVLLVTVALLRLVHPGPGDSNPAPIVAALTYTTNWYEILTGGSYFGLYEQPTLLLHTWSLAIEEQFYLAFPIILFVLMTAWSRHSRRLAVVVGLMAALSATWAVVLWHRGASVDRIYMGTDTRVQGLLVGAGLALLLISRGRPVRSSGSVTTAGLIGLVILGASLFVAQDVSLLFSGGFFIIALATAAVIVGCLTEGPVSRVLSWRPLVALGVISYSVYLWHYPIFAWLQVRDGVTSWAPQVWSFVVTLLVATASYVVVERPFLRGGFTRWSAPRQLGVYALAGGVVVALCLPESGALERAPVESWPGAVAVPDSILVMGDSVALGLDMHYPRDRYATEVGGSYQIGCGYSTRDFRTNLGVFTTDVCQQWRAKATQYISDKAPEAVVVAAPVWDLFPRVVAGLDHPAGTPVFNQEFRDRMADVLDTAGGQGARPVYVIKYGCMLAPGTGADVDAGSIAIANSLIDEVAATRPDVYTVDPSPLTCDGTRSVDVLDGITLRDDGMHWTPRGGELLWSLILGQMATDRATRSAVTRDPAS